VRQDALEEERVRTIWKRRERWLIGFGVFAGLLVIAGLALYVAGGFMMDRNGLCVSRGSFLIGEYLEECQSYFFAGATFVLFTGILLMTGVCVMGMGLSKRYYQLLNK